jgi:acid phosphatase
MSTLFTQAYGVEHPSQPNYLDLFSGGNQGVTNNNVPSSHFTTANLARELINAGKTFISYSQNLPSVGYDGASSGKYMRKHNPITNWMGTGTNQVSSTLNQPFTSFPSDYTTLPTVSFVIPDQDYDMHDGTISTGDTWFHNNLDGYVQWAKTHNSLFILLFDEDDGNYNNRIAMIFTGPMVKSGTLSTTYNHYNVLRTIEDMYGTSHAGNASSVSSIHGCWVNGYKQTADIELAGQGFRWEVFPNPASTMINISYEMEDVSDPNVTVYDNLGQKLTNFYLPETGSGNHQVSFSTSELRMNKGIYFLEIQVADKKYLKKIAVLE